MSPVICVYIYYALIIINLELIVAPFSLKSGFGMY